MPTPCSPVIEPPIWMQNSMISSPRANRVAELLFVALVEKNDGVQVAVARVKHVADLQAVFLADLADAPQRGRKFRARNHAVLRVVARRQPARRAKRVLAAFPQQIAFARVASHAHFARVMQPQTSATSFASASAASRSPSTSISRTAAQSSGNPA